MFSLFSSFLGALKTDADCVGVRFIDLFMNGSKEDECLRFWRYYGSL